MLEFKKPSLEDRQWVMDCVNASGYMGCEYSFCNIFVWSDTYKTSIARYKEFFIAKSGSPDNCRYSLPAGKGSLKEPIEEILLDAERNNIKPAIYGVTESHVALLEELFPNKFSFNEYRDGFDYIYLSDDLINLAGRKYHSKRNHLSNFNKNYNSQYEPIDKSNINDCFELHRKWKEMDRNSGRTDLNHEVCALTLALKNFFELGLFGAILRVDGEPIAFTIADKITDKTVDVHFEKALDGFNGAYAAINQKFCQNALSGFEYINREEDLGIEGLRKAKLSYKPAILLKKYTATLK